MLLTSMCSFYSYVGLLLFIDPIIKGFVPSPSRLELIPEENGMSKTFLGGVGKGEARGVGMTIKVKHILGHLQCTIRGFRFNTSLSIAYF